VVGLARGRWASGGSLVGPQDMEQEAEPQQGDQQQFRENQVGDHDVALSHRGEMEQSYLICGFRNYPFAGGTQPNACHCCLKSRLLLAAHLHSRLRKLVAYLQA
jgi:hypothetical protein